MHALLVFLVFIAVVSVLVFMINKDRNLINEKSKVLKDEESTFEAKELAGQEIKKLNKKVLNKSIAIVILIILFYIVI